MQYIELHKFHNSFGFVDNTFIAEDAAVGSVGSVASQHDCILEEIGRRSSVQSLMWANVVEVRI